MQEFSEGLKNPFAPAGSIMSSSERQVADVLGPQAFVGITGGNDTLGNKKFLNRLFVIRIIASILIYKLI